MVLDQEIREAILAKDSGSKYTMKKLNRAWAIYENDELMKVAEILKRLRQLEALRQIKGTG